MFTCSSEEKWDPIMGWDHLTKQRQELPIVVCPNGAVYVAGTQFLINHGTFISKDMVFCEMPRERSLDIDDEFDIIVFETIVNLGLNKNTRKQEH
jgi:CMP-N-acetylneuraminic acid synthetase